MAINSRAILILIAGAICLAVIFAYAGSSWAIVTYRLLTDGLLALLWLLAAAGLGAFPLRWIVGAQKEFENPLLQFVTSAALGLGLFSLAILGLGLASAFGRAAAFGLVALGLAAGIIWLTRNFDRDPMAKWSAGRATSEWFLLIGMPFLSIAILGALVPAGFLWGQHEPNGYDVVEYHLQVPREWFEAGRIVPLSHNVFSYLPFNVENHYLLAMELRGGPWAGMYLAQLMHAMFCVLAILAVGAIAGRGSGAVIAALAAAVTPWVTMLAPMAYDEGGLLLFGTLAIGWALRALTRAGDDRSVARNLLLSGLMAGFAAGSKLPALPMLIFGIPSAVAAVVVLQGWIQKQDCLPMRGLAVGLLAFVLASLAILSPWLIRNAVWAHNPIFPEGTSIFGPGDFSPVQVERWNQSLQPSPEEKSPGGRLKTVWTQIVGDWRFGFVLIPLALLAAALARKDRGTLFLLLMLGGFALFWIAFTHLQGRFFVLAIPVCAILIGRAAWNRWFPAVGAALAAMALVGYFGIAGGGIHPQFTQLAFVFGVEDLSSIQPQRVADLEKTGAKLHLVGDAKAFWYQVPMSRLTYRTVFDVDTTNPHEDLIHAWLGGDLDTSGNNYVLIDPGELARFSRTYYGIPPDRTSPEELARLERDSGGHVIDLSR